MSELPSPQPAYRGDIDWRLFAPLLAHVITVHTVIGVIRVTTSYRAIELGLPTFWLGAIAAGFALLPIFLALKIGRYIDRGYDTHAGRIGSAILLIAGVGLWLWPVSAVHLFVFTALLGTGHMFLMAAQQMITVRSATQRGREATFGHYMVAVSIGQGLGPFIVGSVGGTATVPATGPLFVIGVIAALLCVSISFAIRPSPGRERHDHAAKIIPLGALLRLPGMLAVLTASVVTVTAGDLLVIYMPLLGAERGIDANHIGMLLLVRSVAGLVARVFYARLIYSVGRLPLTLWSTFIAAGAFALVAVPLLPVMYAAMVVLGLGLGIASTLTISGIVDVSPPEAHGTAMTLRITGNRIGLVLMPLCAGAVAAITGVAGILLLTAVSLATSAVAIKRSHRQP